MKAIDPTGEALNPGQQAVMAGLATLLGGGLAGLAGANALGGATAAQNEVLNNTDNHTEDVARSGGLVSKVTTAVSNAFSAYNNAQAQQALVDSSVAQAVGTALAPRVAGGLQVSGGAGMAALGSNLVVGGLASCLETAGFGCSVAAGGGLLTFAGADNMASGSTLTLTGQYLPTLGAGVVGNALPVNQQTAEVIYGSLTAGLGGKLAPVMFTMPANEVNAVVDPRKFSDYIFKAGADHGKNVVFESLGYTADDSADLSQIWRTQAAQKYASGDFTFGRADQYGQRVNIEITLTGKGAASGQTSYLQSGWMVQSDGSLKLNTPFSGFTRSRQ